MDWAELSDKVEIKLPTPEEGDDRHMKMLEAIAPYARTAVPSNVTTVEVIPSTKKSSIAFVLLPEWSAMFVPFNIARLSSIALKAGYRTKCYDFNVELYNYIQRTIIPAGKLSYDPWDGARSHKWSQKEEYFKDLHPLIEEKLEGYVNDLLELNPTVIGFSIYYTNEPITLWVAKKIITRAPHIKLIIGGPGMQIRAHNIKDNPDFRFNGKHIFKYAITGEAEKIILDVLDEVEAGVEHEDIVFLTQPETQRLNISNFPIPDYKDFDFNKYQIPNGILTEFSRGCVAKCTFCEETHFWNYRQRNAISAIEEIEHLYYNKGTNVVWFLDSLVNGNLKELRGFCKGVIAKKLSLKWTGYARCDGRMDDEFFKDLADSGCFMLNYGCESGSDKVLEDIDKRVTKVEMEANFKLAAKYGIQNMTNWIVGFPTEGYNDFADTMTLLWRNKDNNITVIATAPGFGLGVQTIVGQNPGKFGLQNIWYMGMPISFDLKYSKIHLLIRVKCFAIFCSYFRDHTKVPNQISIPNRPNLLTKHTNIIFDDNRVEYFTPFEENIDFNIIETDKGDFANSIMNEIFVFLRMIWRMKGGYRAEINFREELEMEEFGGGLACPLTAKILFKIDTEGNWEGSAKYEFVQGPSNHDDENPWPWKCFDLTSFNSAASRRALKLSKGEEMPFETFLEWKDKAARYNHEVDLSFKHEWSGSGKWECTRVPSHKLI